MVICSYDFKIICTYAPAVNNLDVRFMFAYAARVGYLKRQDMREAAKATGQTPTGGMHPPAWNQNHRLLDWPGCTLDLACGSCGSSMGYPCKLLAARHGNRTFADVLHRLKCRRCREAPSEIYLVAGHHRKLGPGPNPDWSLPLRIL